MRPKGVKLSATTTEQSEQLGPALREVLIKNIGNNDVYIDFDNDVDINNSYLLEAGESITIAYNFIYLHYKAVSGTTSIYILKIIQ